MKKKFNNKMFISLILLIFLISINLSFSKTSLAKYSIVLSDTKKSKTVASFDVSAIIPNANISISPLDEYDYIITVTNNSDVAVSYDIFFSNIPEGIFISIDESEYSDGNSIWYAKNVGVIDVNNKNKIRTHKIKFKTSKEVTEIIDRTINIQVIFNQIMPQ